MCTTPCWRHTAAARTKRAAPLKTCYAQAAQPHHCGVRSPGLTREAYTELVVAATMPANAILEEAFAEWAARNAKAEALLRAFDSGSTLEQFADMAWYDPRSTGQATRTRVNWPLPPRATHPPAPGG